MCAPTARRARHPLPKVHVVSVAARESRQRDGWLARRQRGRHCAGTELAPG